MNTCIECGKPSTGDLCDTCWEGTNVTVDKQGLPEFEGGQPTKQQIVFTGSHAIQQSDLDAHPLDGIVWYVVQCEVLGVNHKHDANGPLRRIETLSVKRYGELPAGEGATLTEKYAPKKPDELELDHSHDDDEPEIA